jgi:hypothetical protein
MKPQLERPDWNEQRIRAPMPQDFTLHGVDVACELARCGNASAIALVWRGARELAETILAIASHNPGRLQKLAGDSVYMPVLLSRSKAFNNEVATLPERLNLACETARGSRPHLRLDAAATRFLAEEFERLERKRRRIQAFACERPKSESPRKWLVKTMAFEPRDVRLFLKLKPLSGATREPWWNSVIEPWLNDRETMAEVRKHYPKLYRELSRAAKASNERNRQGHGKTELDLLKARCKSALAALAQP